jgi:hypothetical protein
MSTTEQDWNSFARFAILGISSGSNDLSIDELFDQWRMENPSDEHFAENVAAVQASIRDLQNGERGKVAAEHPSELRRKFGSPGE